MPQLQSLLTHLSATVLGDPRIEITGVAYDSRQVAPGSLFACLPGGHTHGGHFLHQALASGAHAVLVEDPALVPPGTTAVVVPEVREALAWIAAAFYGYPSEALTLVGVTGTNGKTTTTTLLRHLLEAAGHPTGLIGTVGYQIGAEVLKAPHTTPQALELQALLARMRDAGLTHVVMEISSHALCQHRVTGCRFHAAAFTNLTQDHLDYHQTLDAYAAAKAELFANPRYQPAAGQLSILSADDPWGDYMAAHAVGVVRRWGTTGGDYQACNTVLGPTSTAFRLRTPQGEVPVHLPLVGAFNVANALVALTLAIELGVPPAAAVAALATAPPVSGRFQRISGSGAGTPTVVVDYAHTPDGLEKVLQTAEELAPGRVTVVFGCGGDRDRTKRPRMGAIAARHAARLVITSDNPRSEDPDGIIAEILAGLPPEAQARSRVEPDRARAIRQAIHTAAPDELVLIAGKGHEDYQLFADRTIHFDDREEATAALASWPGDVHQDAPSVP
jgi:UDP-N-acetylmuramoyl-L-alanyl-D-glutamate--2,6-diaminopimelate ligase